MINELSSGATSFFISGTEQVLDPFTGKDMLELYKTAIENPTPFFLIGVVQTDKNINIFTDGCCLRGYAIEKIEEQISKLKYEVTTKLAQVCLINRKDASLDEDLRNLGTLEELGRRETLTTKKINELLNLLPIIMPNEAQKIEQIQFFYFSTFELFESKISNLNVELKLFSQLYKDLKVDSHFQEHRFFDAVNYHLTGAGKEIGLKALLSFALDLEEVNKISEAKDCYIALAQRFNCLTQRLIKKSDIDFVIVKDNVISEYLNRFA